MQRLPISPFETETNDGSATAELTQDAIGLSEGRLSIAPGHITGTAIFRSGLGPRTFIRTGLARSR